MATRENTVAAPTDDSTWAILVGLAGSVIASLVAAVRWLANKHETRINERLADLMKRADACEADRERLHRMFERLAAKTGIDLEDSTGGK